MSRPQGRAWKRLFSRLPVGLKGAGPDPGGTWAAEALRPLGRQTIEFDVTRRVMARIAAERGGLWPVTAPVRATRLAWISSLLLASAAFVLLGSTILMLVLGGDEGVRQLADLMKAGGHLLLLAARLVAEFGGRALALVLPYLRALRVLVEVAAPLLRGAGLVAAFCGALAILFSTYVFASARKTAPRVNFQGGIR
jgi:hypothetical protein